LGLNGFYRAKCLEANIDNNDYGAIRIWVPDLHTDLDPDAPETTGLIALPGNNPVGGRNNTEKGSYGWGTIMVPRPGDWIWVFFEAGDPSKPFYFAALNIKNSKLPPEHRLNQEGVLPDEPHTVYTIIKTHQGRSIVVADSPDIQRIEISGKYQSGPATDENGDSTDPYTIDDNQTTILFDERTGKEKVLIRTHKGDFLHIDIDEQKLQAYFAEDITIKTDANLHIQVAGDVHYKVTGNVYEEVIEERHSKIGGSYYVQTDTDIHTTVSGNVLNNVTGNQDELVGGNLSEAISGNKGVDVGGKLDQNIGADKSEKVGAKLGIDVGAKLDIKTGTDFNIDVGAAYGLNAAADIITMGARRMDQTSPPPPAVPTPAAPAAPTPATPMTPPTPIDPEGDRDT